MSTKLNLMHMQPDPERLAAWAVRHRLLGPSGDMGYAFHGLLRAVFGERAPASYRYLDSDQALLAYSDVDFDELQRIVALAPLDAAAALGLGGTRSHSGINIRQFPTVWPTGHVLGFECRVRPVIREGKTGREWDAFLAAVDKADGRAVERAQVYAEWLGEQFGRHKSAEIVDVGMNSFRVLDVIRKTQRAGEGSVAVRKARIVGGPDAILAGHLRVGDPEAFSALLARGVGRHRAFGFGMLLLRPAKG
jgi:CRISPR system Cascade subunit CasE